MNKVFKVIWSEARNCYVVVSEMAKNCSKSCSTKKLLAMLVATGVMTCAVFGVAEADADRGLERDVEYKQLVNKDTGLYSSEIWHYVTKGGQRVHFHGAGGGGALGDDKCGEMVYDTKLTIGDVNKVFKDLSANDVLLYNKSIKSGTISNGKITLRTEGNTDIELEGIIPNTYINAGSYNTRTKMLELSYNDQTNPLTIDLSGIQGGGWKLSTNGGSKVADVVPGGIVDLSPSYNAAGHSNIIITADNDNPKNVKFHLNGNLQGITRIENQGASIDLDGAAKRVNINNVIDIDKSGKISGVAAGVDASDAVNVGQLNQAISGLNLTKVEAGTNVAVSEVTDPETGKITAYKVNADATSVSGTGNITVTAGAKDATTNITNYEVTLNKDLKNIESISNNDKSIGLAGDNLLLQNGDAVISIDAEGRISGVAAAVSDDQAVNLGQLREYTAGMDTHVKAGEYTVADNKVTMDIVDKEDKTTGQVVIKNIASKTELDDVRTLAAKHNTVAAGANITVSDKENDDGGREYKVALDENIVLDSVTTGKTVLNDNGVTINRETSLTADALKINSKTYIDENGINANEQKITNVADAELSATSMDAVNGSQLHATNQKVMENSNRISRLGDRVNKVGAGAAALAALHPMDFDPDDKWSFAAGYGNYAGQNAAAIGAYYRPDEKVMFSVGGTVGNGENMVNAGISFALDRTNRVSNSRTAMAREIVDLRGQLVEMGAKVAKMEAMFGMLDESKTMLFPDIPENHWAYEYVAKLAGNGILEGYPDGSFSGDRMMTRYEFAAMLYRAIEKGQALEARVLKEFAPELGRIRVERIHGEDNDKNKVERVRVNSGKTYGMRDNYGSKIR